MSDEIPTWTPWTPEEKKLHEETLKHIQKSNEEIIKKGEIDTINALRKQIRNDVEEYNLFRQTPYISGDEFNFYRNYLLERIDINIAELKELVEDKNE